MNSLRKIKLRIPAPKPRNPLVSEAMHRKAGPHRKTNAARRHAENIALAKSLRQDDA